METVLSGRLNNGLPVVSTSLGPDCVTSHGKGDSADVTKLRTSRWKTILGCVGGPHILTRVLVRGKQEDRRQRGSGYDAGPEDAGGATRQGIWAPLEAGKGNGILLWSLQKDLASSPVRRTAGL